MGTLEIENLAVLPCGGFTFLAHLGKFGCRAMHCPVHLQGWVKNVSGCKKILPT